MTCAVPGVDEAVSVVQVGNLQPLFKEEYPKCWGTYEECSTRLLSSIHYTQARLLLNICPRICKLHGCGLM